MEEIYRGDTFEFDFETENVKTGEPYTFVTGSILKCAIKKNLKETTDYMAKKEIEVMEDTTIVSFCFDHEEMTNLKPGEAILEIELTIENKVYTLFQDKILIKGDAINE